MSPVICQGCLGKGSAPDIYIYDNFIQDLQQIYITLTGYIDRMREQEEGYVKPLTQILD